MRCGRAALAALSIFLFSACGGGGQGASSAASAPSEEPSATAGASAVPAASESAGPQASPPGSPAPTPNPNLLSPANGTIVRTYPAVFSEDADVRNIAENTPPAPDGAKGPLVFVFELPGTASFTGFSAELPGGDPAATVTFAVSSTSADSGFTDAGSVTGSADSGTKSVAANATGRWVRVTESRRVPDVAAAGTIAPPPAGVHPSGVYIEEESPFAKGAFVPAGVKPDHWLDRFAFAPGGLTAVQCYEQKYGDTMPGTLQGRTWSVVSDNTPYAGAFNDDASIVTLVQRDGNPIYYVRASGAVPPACDPFVYGSGPKHLLALDDKSMYGLYPMDKASPGPGIAFTSIAAGMLDRQMLDGQDTVATKMICNFAQYTNPAQQQLLLDWVAAGHKLLLYSADECGNGSDYAWLPYPFKSSNPGAKGAHGDRLIQVENDALGTSDKNDAAHFFDPQSYAKDESNQLGDADTVVTQDAHWCGHLFGTNANNVNGFMQMYAVYGKGTIVYDAFDHDDGDLPAYQRVRALELALDVPSDLPCTQSVALSFLVVPDREAAFSAGTASTVNVTMETLANQGWKGHVDVKTTGDFPATVTPAAFDLSGGTQPLAVSVAIPASAKPGVYTVTVTATGSDGKTAQAHVTLTGTAPLKKAAIKKHERIRIYGIHFDYDSAHIQPRSEPVIAQIAALLRANPDWRFEVSGHTDSDGGAAYNLALSQRRAQAVVDDLVARYHIARARLVARGYGLSRPVATNATPAGKALNRRVELERLQ